MIDTYQGKLCCPKCHHLINIEESEPLENCPYCKKKLPQDNIEFWRHTATTREIRKRNFDDALSEHLSSHQDWLDKQKEKGRYPTREEALKEKMKRLYDDAQTFCQKGETNE